MVIFTFCGVSQVPQKIDVQLYLHSAVSHRSPKGRRYVHPNGTLHIRKVAHRVKGKLKMSDEGMYECYVTNSVGTVLAQRLQLFIASKMRARIFLMLVRKGPTVLV